MIVLMVFTLIGMVIGEIAFSGGGWLIGGALGFLITKVSQMNTKVNRLERDLNLLQEQQKNYDQKKHAAPINVSVQPESQTENRQSVSSRNVSPTEARAPLADRLKAHGIDLPPESSSTTELPITDKELESLALATTPESISSQELKKADPVVARPQSFIHKQEKPAQPNPIEKAVDYVRRFFTEGNPIVRIGMVVMFFGLSFLVKYASNQGLLPLELRMAAVAAVAIALIGIGWKTRTRAGGYGLVLQGGGIAALYLTVFVAAKMYSLMPTGVAFGLMFIIVMLGVMLAVLQNAQVLALMATAGGFLAPILTSDGSGNHVGLFSFYLLLNLGILAIAWFKTWRMLNWVGFVFTFVITSTWGVLKYEPHLYASTQPFLLAFFALYLIVSVLFSLKQPPNLKGLVDGSLVFGLPIVGFGLQTALLRHTEYGLAISALILAVIYMSLARFLWGKYQQTHRVLIESFIALGVTFATLTIPLALDAQWTSATWALEATGLIWIGLRQQRFLPRLAGYLLHLAAALSLLIHDIHAGATPIISGDFIGLFILAASAFCISWLLNCFMENTNRFDRMLTDLAMIIGWIWWLVAGYIEINAHVPGEQHLPSFIVFFSLSTAALSLLSVKIQWVQLTRIGFWLLPLTVLFAMSNLGEGLFLGYDIYPSQSWGLLAWIIFAAVQYRFLWRRGEQGATGLLSVYHVLTAWFLLSLVYWEASYWQHELQWFGTSAAILWFACLVVPLVALLYFTKTTLWPFAQYTADYKNLIPVPLIFFVLLWFIYACSYSGITNQFYLPILNPLDLAQAAVLLIFGYAIKRGFIGLDKAPAEMRYGLIGILGFVWINTVLLRAVHHYAAIDYVAYTMWNSVVVQMALSILWAVCALVIMNLSRRIQMRELWMMGMGLLILIVIKLFTKDLSGAGTLAGIVSFMVVGGLMLLIGYLSPIPAKNKSANELSEQ
ncbi:MAG: hypothetical protein B0W54_20175 [Cellvibrio sp. 79]|nr:MAG: hypothetical protein B0W54_20175 [Cellvibrio sp. 79]